MDNVYQVMKAHLDLLKVYDEAAIKVGGEFDGSDLAVELENNLGRLVVDFTGYSQGELEDKMLKATLPERLEMYKGIIISFQWDLVELKLTDNTVAYWEN